MPVSEPLAVTIGAALASGARRLTAAGCDTPRLDAELLLAAALDPFGGVDRARLVLDRDRPVKEPVCARYEAMLERRAGSEPVAYILGRRHFRRLELRVDPRVLIPRPETELLVEVGLEAPEKAAVVDVGTGSGAVALALKDERPDLLVRGTDLSADALAVAQENAAALGLQVWFNHTDLLDDAPADVVLANLPYVPDGAELPRDVAGFEPASALFAGGDGLDVVRRLVERVTPGRVRLLALEIGPEQAGEVAGLLRAAAWPAVEVRADLAGRDRVVVGRA